MLKSPSEGIDLSTIKADILSGDPQNIQSALDQLQDFEQWKAMGSRERVGLADALKSVCGQNKKVGIECWKYLAEILIQLEPDYSIEFLEWMWAHPDPEMKKTAQAIQNEAAGLPSNFDINDHY